MKEVLSSFAVFALVWWHQVVARSPERNWDFPAWLLLCVPIASSVSTIVPLPACICIVGICKFLGVLKTSCAGVMVLPAMPASSEAFQPLRKLSGGVRCWV